MEKTKRIKTANILRKIARYTLLAIGVLVFVFALFSGAEGYGGGINGLIKNSPNAWPWLMLLALLYYAWKQELIGGIIITSLGLFMIYFFNMGGNNFFIVTFVLSLLITILGLMFILSWYLRKE